MTVKSVPRSTSKSTSKRSGVTTPKRPQAKAARASSGHRAENKYDARAVHHPKQPSAHGLQRVDLAKEWPDFLTPMGGFTQLKWVPLRDVLADFQAGALSPTGGGRYDMVPVDPKELRAKLESHLKRPDIEREMFAKANIYEVEERFLRPYGLFSRNDLDDLMYRGEPAYVKVNRGEEPSPLYGAAKTVFDHAAADPKYAALLECVRRDPITAMLLVRGADKNADRNVTVRPHEARLVNDLMEVAYAATLLNVDGTLVQAMPTDNPGLRRLTVRYEWEHAAENAMKQVADSKKATPARLAAAMEGLSFKKHGFSLD